MGYSTEFRGEFKFTKELTATQLAKLKSYLDEDCRDHPEWNVPDLYYVNLELLDDFSGITWNGAEKTDDLTDYLNLIINGMKEIMSDFGLKGKMLCQGENIEDRYEIVIKDGLAVHIDTKPSGAKIICPHCEEEFYLN